ncbi:hypothetical protein HPB50_014595 [Hyalomma asiaticum]|uniref:Uncharacterized protein n=1 Tax=Hyalomma asiaticum TaxID=266040 RepID=A0ACB7T1T2_HYAAI|nr:hypothetical protein HPB50_014595 [Hyalomma asiaticum]
MLREILLRVIPHDSLLKYHELPKPMTTAVSTMQAQRDPEDRTTKIEKEPQDLLEFLELISASLQRNSGGVCVPKRT